MTKITFRADDDLVEEVDRLEASKSEVMREALREYLDAHAHASSGDRGGERGQTIDDLVAERVDALVEERVGTLGGAQDVNVNITVDGTRTATEESPDASVRESPAEPSDDQRCAQCGEQVSDAHTYCPNCGEKAVNRVFCDCGDELRTDWAYCPGCGRRTPSADVLER